MNAFHDPELDDLLQESDLRRVAELLRLARAPEPPLDDAYQTGLRRQLMLEAWSMAEGRGSAWWRRLFAPPGLAWAGAVAGVLLIAAVAVWTATQQNGSLNQVFVASPQDGKNNVALAQPILVSFNQPMDHQSTEAAVQITPATSVAYAWDAKSVTLQVTPVSGNLAPNTQYQVTIGPGAKTAGAQQLAQPQTITFVTQAPATPTPTPSPTPRPSPANPLNEKQLAALKGSGGLAWSVDSQTIYFVDLSTGALQVVSLKGGPPTVIAPSGAWAPVVSPAGDQLAYVLNGKIEILTFASGKTDELAPSPTPTLVAWAKDKVEWSTRDGIYEETDSGKALLVALPTTGGPVVQSISPDGSHAVYRTTDGTLDLLDIASGNSTQLAQSEATQFSGWSPDGTQFLLTTAANLVVSDLRGATLATLPVAQASWSSNDAILLGGDTNLSQVRPDGSNLTRLANGTYRSPVWAPDGNSFAFVRGDSLWVATAPSLPPEPTIVDEATTVVKKFMDARLGDRSVDAAAFLDDSGKKAYGAGQLNLVITGDPHFTRYYLLTHEAVGTQPDTVRFVVRLVLTHGKKDVSDVEETLTLVRDATTKQFLVDQATAGAQRDLGKGPEVVSVDVAATTIQVTFDSDLDPATVNGGVTVVDAKGNPIDATVTYSGKVVTISSIDLKAGAQYRLVVMTSVRDVQGQKVQAEYDLDLLGPAANRHAERKAASSALASPTPAVSPSAGTSSG
ncbi:MAG TPA: Ig-like domain-containing protein [Candidatus Dormibacteraeota bacterium]|nr:Ig-like domain-containing protein [Candidatus Dormibacteraeota bacterium]